MEAHSHATPPADGPTLGSLPVEPLLTAGFDVDPGAVYERLRGTYGPVAPVGLLGVPVWLVLGYTEVTEVLRNESLWRRDIRYWRARAEGRLPRDWPLLAGYEVRQTMFMDDDEHLAARRTHHSALSPFQDARSPEGWQLRATVARYADELVGMLAAESGSAGFADLGAQYTRPLLLMVTTKLFGCPVELGDELVMDLWRMLDGGPDSGPATARALGAFTRLAAHRRARPGDDLTSYLLLADPGLSDEQLGRELFMNAVYLNDITGNMVLNTLLEVLRGNATVRRSLSAGQIGETVNRAALANPPVANMCFRFAARDVRLGEVWVRAGDAVSPSAAAAHRDLLALSSSHLVGSTVSTRAHLGWGAGAHQCPSAARELGGMIVATAVGRVLDHFARAELTLPPDQLPWRSGPVVRGLRLLPVRYELRAGALPAQRPEPAGPSTAPTADGYARRLLTVLRRLMPGGREEDPMTRRAGL
ncbi:MULTISPECIES: cytochrome P450 [unclassified Streptomyces]|uniref:cytochrome P450 n=1 Tax=unclassified Streptomyces TaxID=2593676 RepID=UPI000F4F0CC4|nr:MULTISPECIES: cytochrome P450 [unclassified Streptomyces]MDH6452994.1 cytochrome P450 [Streptomyces sp. SAI-119]MDH6496447.1 cytochrome P450 [Streptomyces sp. SAI-149]QUC56743.1 cytochrome P450 [Streptomyces sp. A2-16]GLP71950.1 cytochrome P450 [Streptomyces sp. TUS-ST3]